MKYGRIHELRQEHPVAAMCRVLDVSESGYHAGRKRPLSPRAKENARLAVEIKAAHERTRQTYGPERLQADLAGTASRSAFIASGVSARNWACAVGRSGNSRQPRIRATDCPSRRICWIASLP